MEPICATFTFHGQEFKVDQSDVPALSETILKVFKDLKLQNYESFTNFRDEIAGIHKVRSGYDRAAKSNFFISNFFALKDFGAPTFYLNRRLQEIIVFLAQHNEKDLFKNVEMAEIDEGAKTTVLNELEELGIYFKQFSEVSLPALSTEAKKEVQELNIQIPDGLDEINSKIMSVDFEIEALNNATKYSTRDKCIGVAVVAFYLIAAALSSSLIVGLILGTAGVAMGAYLIGRIHILNWNVTNQLSSIREIEENLLSCMNELEKIISENKLKSNTAYQELSILRTRFSDWNHRIVVSSNSCLLS